MLLIREKENQIQDYWNCESSYLIKDLMVVSQP